MKIQWIKLRASGAIEKLVKEHELPSVGDGVFIDDIGYEVKGIVTTPHLDCTAHVFVFESAARSG